MDNDGVVARTGNLCRKRRQTKLLQNAGRSFNALRWINNSCKNSEIKEAFQGVLILHLIPVLLLNKRCRYYLVDSVNSSSSVSMSTRGSGLKDVKADPDEIERNETHIPIKVSDKRIRATHWAKKHIHNMQRKLREFSHHDVYTSHFPFTLIASTIP